MNILELKLILRHDPDTGYLYRIDTGRRVYEESHGGYTRITIKGRRYKTHRVVWALHHGEWPDSIDHINHDRADNRIQNLRSIPVAENLRNKSRDKRNTSGKTGVSWDSRTNKWFAKICVDKKQISLGLFADKEDAIAARVAAERAAGFHPNHGM
jgi:hypothetical protein